MNRAKLFRTVPVLIALGAISATPACTGKGTTSSADPGAAAFPSSDKDKDKKDAGPAPTPDAGPVVMPVDAGIAVDPLVAQESAGLASLADGFRTFHRDTGGWPYYNTVWRAEEGAMGDSPQIDPSPFGLLDTALFKKPEALANCGNSASHPCWKGPYFNPAGPSLASPDLLDAWGNARMFAFIRPPDTLGGGVSSAPDGRVIVWSMGPDGIDQTGCFNTPVAQNCGRDMDRLVEGMPSLDGSDDLVVVIGSAR